MNLTANSALSCTKNKAFFRLTYVELCRIIALCVKKFYSNGERMKKWHVYFNPISGNGTGEKETEKLNDIIKEDKVFIDLTKSDMNNLFAQVGEEDNIVISGGDGTLNRLINETDIGTRKNDIYYFACGSGNDFLRDIKSDSPLVKINEYLVDLPTVTVKGKTYRFLNGIGYGIDGYCCEKGDELRLKPGKKVNYTSIAIKGLLFFYKPKNARITVDGQTYTYKKVWLAPTMNGRYYGGGMNCAPEQDRLNKDRTVSTVIMYGSGKLKTLMVFPTIFKGEHVGHTEMVEVHTGHEIKVEFDAPCALQIDGETILGVTEYSVSAK